MCLLIAHRTVLRISSHRLLINWQFDVMMVVKNVAFSTHMDWELICDTRGLDKVANIVVISDLYLFTYPDIIYFYTLADDLSLVCVCKISMLPVLTYAAPVRGSTCDSNYLKLQVVQKKCEWLATVPRVLPSHTFTATVMSNAFKTSFTDSQILCSLFTPF